MDKKQSALNALVYALHCTRAGDEVLCIDISDDECTATIVFTGGGSKAVNVEGNSGISCLVAVCQALM